MAKSVKDKGIVIRWIIAIAVAAAAMWLLALCLKGCNRQEPQATEPTVVSKQDGIPGIDVSSHQGEIDWQAVADSGVRFAFVRLGYRGYDSGTIHVDSNARQNLEGARAAGLQVGAYFFSQALTGEEALEEAELALEVLGEFKLDLPLVYDWEFVSKDARTGAMTPQELLACVHSFCGEVEAAGYGPMLYFNRELARTLLDLDRVKQYPFWLASYTEELNFSHEVRFWQYTDQGSVPGIEGNVDLDVYFPEK